MKKGHHHNGLNRVKARKRKKDDIAGTLAMMWALPNLLGGIWDNLAC